MFKGSIPALITPFIDDKIDFISFEKIIKWSIDKQIEILDFGVFTVNEKPNMGLARFKENFGANGVLRNTLELKL